MKALLVTALTLSVAFQTVDAATTLGPMVKPDRPVRTSPRPSSAPATLPPTEQKLLQETLADISARVKASDPEFLDEFRRQLNQRIGDEVPVGKVLGSISQNLAYQENSKWLINANANRQVGVRIIGGTVSDDGEFPDCVAVGNSSDWCCTGTLVASNLVITAAHCVKGGCDTRVYFGDDVSKLQSVGVLRLVTPPALLAGYAGSPTHKNDIAVLLLDEDVTGVQLRPLASSTEINAARFVRLVGFGSTNFSGVGGGGVKREVDVPVVSVDCNTAADRDSYGCNPGIELVAGAPFLNRDSCNGDSGGPAYVWHQNNWVLAGVTSRLAANSIRACGDGGIYTRVDQFADWIRSIPGAHWPK